MKHYTATTEDGRCYGGTPPQIVRSMRDEAWFAEDTKGAYMEAVAHRAWVRTGRLVRHSTPYRFLTDLQAAGLINLGRAQ
jgi:hypothetical protein